MKYVIYYRVSTKKQGDSGLGLESQKAICEHYIPQDQVIGVFTEIKSAKNIRNRTELQSAIEMANSHKATLVVAKVDRLSRVTEDALSIYRELDGRLICCDIPNVDKFTLTLFMAIAERERELIRLRTKQALKAKKERGEKLGNTRYLTHEGRKKGWESNREKAREQDDNLRATATIVMYRQKGLSYAAIADRLNKTKFKTANGKKMAPMTVKRLYDRAVSYG
jgi:DNA invertase Pin-like site-specific DNA recombinase